MNVKNKYFQSIAYLESLGNLDGQKDYQSSRVGARICLARTKYLLKLLSNPERKIKNYIHIGGTSGKGSVANMIHEILTASGKKSALFTSPFVSETIEKYKIGNRFVSTKEFVDIVEQIKPAIDTCAQKCPYGVPSYFEVCFVIAVIYFTNNKCEFVVSEVGMGGEFDATNVVKRKKISVITHVDYDHTEILGNTLEQIAHTKSKIISRNCTFLTNEPRPSIRKIFKSECAKQNATYQYVRDDADQIVHKEKYFTFKYNKHSYKLNLWGAHQVKNAILAIEISYKLNIKQEFIKRGIANTKIPGRFEIVNKKPYIILDVAHNPDKVRTTLENIGLLKYDKLHVVYASASNKDLKKIAHIFAEFTDKLYITKYFLNLRKCANPKYIQKIWLKANSKLKADIKLDPWQAFFTAKKNAKKSDIILVVGSFFLVGELRKIWWDSKKILQTRRVI